MKKQLTYGLISGLLLISLTGCNLSQEQPPAAEKSPKTEQKQQVLQSIDLASHGITLEGYHMDLHLSPDGKQAAFSGYHYGSASSPTFKLILANLQSGQVKSYDNASRVLGWLPNAKLLYQYEGTLALLDIQTGHSQTIAQDCWYGASDSSGQRIAYAKRGSGLFIYDLSTGQSRQLTQGTSDRYPVWYPDGKHLFFFKDLGQNLGDGAGNLEGMAKIAIDTGDIELISNETGKFRGAEWIVPGTSLHVLKGWDDGFYHGILNLALGEYTDLGENPGGVSFFTAIDPHKGQLIKSANGQVEIFDAQGEKISSYALAETTLQNFNYSVSPQGDQLAFVQGDFGRWPDSPIKGNKVMLANLDGQNQRELTSQYRYNDTLVWDPSGKNLIALQMDNEKILGIQVIPIPKN